ncbi:unnamed protein product [Didymodactylos carnosus]|nr:unnamed protein product [Didymodactylos carnosus]CAF3570551.1 unnamed protein product [Didymodactylos carnosus]
MAYERRLSSASDSSADTAQSTESATTNEKISSLSSSSKHKQQHEQQLITHQSLHYTPTFTTNESIVTLDQKQPLTRSLTTTTTTTQTTSLKRNTSSLLASPAEQLLARTKNTFVDLNPYFQCSSLPSHWRKNKSLRFVLKPKPDIEIKSNTRVMILAGNEFNPCASLKNNISWFRNGQAEFNDLRFLGASGRGKKFTLTIFVDTTPPQQCTYRRAIKITVDGPRKKRDMKHKADSNSIQEKREEDDSDGDSDHEPSNISDAQTETRAVTQASSGLMILAAAAEQKRQEVLNEDDKDHHSNSISIPMDICPHTTSVYQCQSGSISTPCSSPSSLSSVFATSITFSDVERRNSQILNKTMKNSFLNNNTTVYPVMSNVTNMNGIDRLKIQNESSSTVTSPISSQLTSTTNLIHPVFTFSSKLLSPTAAEYYHHTSDNKVTAKFEPSSASHVLCR